MNERDELAPSPFLVHAYLQHVRPHTRGKPSAWGPSWIEGAQHFGRQLMLLGAALAVLSWFPPEIGWRVLLGGMGLTTAAVGVWHRLYAQDLCELALAKGYGKAPN